MRHDEPTPDASDLDGSLHPGPLRSDSTATTDPPAPRGWVWPAVLGTLATATSLTLALYASAWLIPPYLLLTAWIVGIPKGLHLRARASGIPAEPVPTEPARALGRRPSWFGRGATLAAAPGQRLDATQYEPADAVTTVELLPSDPEGERPLDTGGEPGLNLPGEAKPRRGRGRPRKAKVTPTPPVEPSAGATWVRVGPGKFVRADIGEPISDLNTETPTPGTEAPYSDVTESYGGEPAEVSGDTPEADAGPEAFVPATDRVESESAATPDVTEAEPAFAASLADPLPALDAEPSTGEATPEPALDSTSHEVEPKPDDRGPEADAAPMVQEAVETFEAPDDSFGDRTATSDDLDRSWPEEHAEAEADVVNLDASSPDDVSEREDEETDDGEPALLDEGSTDVEAAEESSEAAWAEPGLEDEEEPSAEADAWLDTEDEGYEEDEVESVDASLDSEEGEPAEDYGPEEPESVLVAEGDNGNAPDALTETWNVAPESPAYESESVPPAEEPSAWTHDSPAPPSMTLDSAVAAPQPWLDAIRTDPTAHGFAPLEPPAEMAGPDSEEPSEPVACVVDVPSVSPSAGRRERWVRFAEPRPRPTRAAGYEARTPRRNACSGGRRRVFPGFRPSPPARRNPRHSGRFHSNHRTPPPRSPPGGVGRREDAA